MDVLLLPHYLVMVKARSQQIHQHPRTWERFLTAVGVLMKKKNYNDSSRNSTRLANTPWSFTEAVM
jgi:hypothetical protein